MPPSIWERFEAYHQNRDPERLELKRDRVAADPLAFFRGTAHLFYEDWPRDKALQHTPLVWLCGDLHIENFGTYRAANRLLYFDINDFDECCLGSLSMDAARLLTSIVIEANARRYKPGKTRKLCRKVLDYYQSELRAGKPRWVESETSTGIVRDLFDDSGRRSASKFLDSRTIVEGRRRFIDVERGKALPADPDDVAALKEFIRDTTKFRVVDAARRIAGNGSLGVPRFVLLVKDKQENLFLLDLKEARPPAPVVHRRVGQQPHWDSEAQRVVETQKLVQAMFPAFLRAVTFRDRAWILKELLPSEDRVEVAKATDHAFEVFVSTLASMMAWGQHRASGRRGAANGDILCACDLPETVLSEFAQDYARQVERDHKEFKQTLSEVRQNSSPPPS